LNHEQELLDYQYTSHAYYLGLRNCDWIDSRRGLQIFGGPAGYERYLRLHGPSIVEAKQRRRDDQAR
jgi:hypothetical protein